MTLVPENELRREPLEAALEVSDLWREILTFDQVGSTNDIAKRRGQEGAPEGLVVIAEEQTAGRGRLQRRWIAPAGTSLLCSLLFRPKLRVDQANRLTMICSLAAADAVEEVSGLAPALKWPNDLVVSSSLPKARGEWRKLGGILTETELSGDRLAFVVVGIGINVNVPAEDLPTVDPHATSVLAETDETVDRTQLLLKLLSGVEERYGRLQEGLSPHREWSQRLATLGRAVTAQTPDGVLQGIAEGVDPNGALLLRTEDGSLRRLIAGDVSLAHP
jgi:BirA family biotin operon repressor/biotin-[acetyl-CoA-carboxylase] ligase